MDVFVTIITLPFAMLGFVVGACCEAFASGFDSGRDAIRYGVRAILGK
jgi:hypothetical protein